jgi:hypothetical protein
MKRLMISVLLLTSCSSSIPDELPYPETKAWLSAAPDSISMMQDGGVSCHAWRHWALYYEGRTAHWREEYERMAGIARILAAKIDSMEAR